MRPRIARAQAGRSWPWGLLVLVTCRVSCRHEQGKGGQCREFGGSVGAECAPFEGGWRTLRTHRPDPATAVTPVMQRRLGGKRWEKPGQRIMSRERETLRVCQLSHYICRDCIRSYVLVSNGEIGGCPMLWGGSSREGNSCRRRVELFAGSGRGRGQAQGLPLPSFAWAAMAPLLPEGKEFLSQFWTAPNGGEA